MSTFGENLKNERIIDGESYSVIIESEKEIKKYSPLPEVQEKKKSESKIAPRPVSPVKKQTAEKNRQIKKKSSNRAIEKKLSLPDLPEPPEAL